MEIRYHLSPQPMTCSGPADSVVPGALSAPPSASVSVQGSVLVRLGLYLLQKARWAEQQRDLQRHNGHRRQGELHHFETGVPGWGISSG